MVQAMRTVVYNIPVHLVPAYRGREVLVRSQDPAELVQALPDSDIEKLVSVQLLSLTADVDALADWGYGVPVELIMLSPDTEFSLLYRHAKLLDKHPVRVSIPALPGLFKAVKVASALRFPVKLEVGQPEPDTDRGAAVGAGFLPASPVSLTARRILPYLSPVVLQPGSSAALGCPGRRPGIRPLRHG